MCVGTQIEVEGVRDMDVTKTWCLISRGGKVAGHFVADTVFIDEIPHVVFEWEYRPDGSRDPVHLVPLDPKYFHPLLGWGEVTQIYEMPVEDPRALD